MRFRELRRVLQTIVLAGLPACTVSEVISGTEVGDCTETIRRHFEVEASKDDAPLLLRIESCRVDQDACMALCSMLMTRAGLSTPQTCDVGFDGEHVEADASFTRSVSNQGCPAEGRRPAGLVTPRRVEGDSAVAAWLARAAWLESASIPAFVYLARELDAHGAPRGLARAALAAARDEIRHAQVMTRLAHAYGGVPPVVELQPPAIRSLEEIAIENAIEGCVRETWGAVVAMWQAQRAKDAQLRAVFRAIADDEARHAALGWAVDQWASTRLSRPAMARVAEARAVAVRELFEGDAPEALAVLGLPRGLEARGLLDRTSEAIWHDARGTSRRGAIWQGGVS